MFVCEKFAHVNLSANLADIAVEDRPVLAHLIRAAHFLNAIYLRQVSHYNPQFKQEIEDSHSHRLIDSFRIMGGPWDRFHDDRPFYGTIEKPLGAGFYPSDMTREEFEAWLANHPEDREDFQHFYTTVRRQSDGSLQSVPYSQTYPLELEKAASLLHEAAALASNASLRRFLNARAYALLSNDYASSDADWIGLDSNIEVVFGPYETYEDRLFGFKAAFEAFIGYRNAEETRKLAHIAEIIDEMQAALPISDDMKATRMPGKPSPFVVIDLLSNAGEARVGVQTLAFVLPNDPCVVEKYGTKKVMMKNVQEAKYHAILEPLAARFLSKRALSNMSFEAFFRHTILHETGHSLGVKAVHNSNETIIHALSDSYAAIEECKADVISTYLSHWLMERGELSREDYASTCATMLAGFFRSMRFGLTQAHAAANAIQLSFLMEHGAVTVDDAGMFDCNADKFADAIAALASAVMDIEYEGSREKAQDFIRHYAVLPAGLEERLKALEDLPVDIVCTFEAEKPEFFA